MAKKTAGQQNREVSPLNCLENDVKLKFAWSVGKTPVDYLSLKSYFSKEHFGWMIAGSAPITRGLCVS
jgi:hypothetical protein